MVNVRIYNNDCLKVLKTFDDGCIDVVVTSPPYNLNIKYNKYADNKDYDDYLLWLKNVFKELYRVMSQDASFYLNIGFSSRNPWLSWDVPKVAQACGFYLQNNITWVKSISVNGESFGHFKPINSKRYINNMFEMIYHFTKTGKVELDRLAIGVPYQHKSNIERWKGGNGRDLRCRGNTWYIPYETITNKEERSGHPATFPVLLPTRCLKLHGIERIKTVLDPFSGIGSTLQAACLLGLFSIGIEMDKKYVDASVFSLKRMMVKIEVVKDAI